LVNWDSLHQGCKEESVYETTNLISLDTDGKYIASSVYTPVLGALAPPKLLAASARESL